MQRRLLPGNQAEGGGLPTAGVEGILERDCLLQGVAADMRRRSTVLHGPRILQEILQVHVPRKEVFPSLSQLNRHLKKARQSSEAQHMQV